MPSSKTMTVAEAELRQGVALQAGEATVLILEAEQAADAAPAPAPEPSLREPRWLKPELVHGADAVMEVLAENADGRSVRFIVERNEQGEWKPHATADGRVEDGKARAQIAAEHPQHGKGDPFVEAGEAELRFRVELV